MSIPIPGLSLPIPGLSISIPFLGRSSAQNPQDQQFQDLVNEGSRHVKAGEPAAGIDFYRRALAIYPNNASVRVNLGNACIKAGRFDEAALELRRAISLAPNLDLAWLDLVAAYTTGNHLELAVGAGREFLRRFPGNRHAATVSQEVENASKELERRRRAVSRDPSGGANSDNYLALACDSGLTRWSLANMPLKVFIDEGKHVRKHKEDFNYQVTRAFDQWSLASAGMIRFKQTVDPKDADINVTWTDGSDIPNITELGEARFDDVRDHEIHHITIVLLTQAGRIHKELTARDIFSVAMHEIGHALGIHGHSDGQRDIMFFCDTPVSQVITMRDANTLQRLYSVPVELYDRSIALQKLGGSPPGVNDLQRPSLPIQPTDLDAGSAFSQSQNPMNASGQAPYPVPPAIAGQSGQLPYPAPYAAQGGASPYPAPYAAQGGASPYPASYAAQGGAWPYPAPYAAQGGASPYPAPYAAQGGASPYPVPYAAQGAGWPYPVPYAAQGAGSPYPAPYAAQGAGSPYPAPYATQAGGSPYPAPFATLSGGSSNPAPSPHSAPPPAPPTISGQSIVQPALDSIGAGLQAALSPVVKGAANAAAAVNDTFAPYSSNPQASPFGSFVRDGVDAIRDAARKD